MSSTFDLFHVNFLPYRGKPDSKECTTISDISFECLWIVGDLLNETENLNSKFLLWSVSPFYRKFLY